MSKDSLDKLITRRDFFKIGGGGIAVGTAAIVKPTCLFPGNAIKEIYTTKNGEETTTFNPEDEMGIHAVINTKLLPISFANGSVYYPASKEQLELKVKILSPGTNEFTWYSTVPAATGLATATINATSGLAYETERTTFEIVEESNVAVEYAQSQGIDNPEILKVISNLGKDNSLEDNDIIAIDITAYMNNKDLGFPSILSDSMLNGTVSNSELIEILSNSNVRFVKQGKLNGNDIYGFASIEPLIPERQQEEYEWMKQEYPEHPDNPECPWDLEETVQRTIDNGVSTHPDEDLRYYDLIRKGNGGYLDCNNYSQNCEVIAQALHPASFFQLQKDFPDEGYTTLEIGVLHPDYPNEIAHVDVGVWDENLNKWIALGTTSPIVEEIVDGTYGHIYDGFVTTWAVDKFLEQTNYDYEEGKRAFIGDLFTGLHLFHPPGSDDVVVSYITTPEQTWRDLAEDILINGYNNFAKEFSILAESMKESELIRNLTSKFGTEPWVYNGMHGIVVLKNNKLIPYFVDKNTFDEMRNNGTGDEPIIP